MSGYLKIEDLKKHNRIFQKNIEKLDKFLIHKSKPIIIEYPLKKQKKQKRIKKKVEKVILSLDDLKEVEIKISSIRNKGVQEPKFIKNHFRESDSELKIKGYLKEYEKLDILKGLINKSKKPYLIYKQEGFYKVFKKELIRRDEELVYKHKGSLIVVSTKNKLKL